jgi:type I restriction enzyme M protein
MLFVKYISDVWRDHYEGYKQKFGDDEERIRRRMSTSVCAARRHGLLLPLRAAQRDQPGRDDRHGPGGHRRSQHRPSCRACSATSASTPKPPWDRPPAQRAPEKPADRLRRPAPGHAPQPHQRPGHHRQRLRVPDRQVRRRRGQEGRRVLHPARSLALLAKLLAPSRANGSTIRPCGSGSLPSSAPRKWAATTTRSTCRRATAHLGAGDDEHVPARHQPAGHQMGRHDRQAAALWKATAEALQRGVANPPFSLDKWGAENAANDRTSASGAACRPRAWATTPSSAT